MKVAFLTRGHEFAGSARVRVFNYLKYLHDLKIETAVVSRPKKSGMLYHASHLAHVVRRAQWADLLFLQKPNQSKRLLDVMKGLNPRIIVDVDDAVWAPPPARIGHPSMRLSRKFRERFIYAVQLSKFVITGSHYLAGVVRQFSSEAQVIVIPPSVDLEKYHTAKTTIRQKDIKIGWIGSPGNFADLLPVLPALRAACAEHGARLTIISSRPPGFNDLSLEFDPWSDQTEVRSLLDLDLGIMPLSSDERSLGRCGYKAVQYMAVGLPVITSPVGAGAEIVKDGLNGFYATSCDDWYEKLSNLIKNGDLRRSMGAYSRIRVEENYSIQKNVYTLVDIFQRSMNSGILQ